MPRVTMSWCHKHNRHATFHGALTIVVDPLPRGEISFIGCIFDHLDLRATWHVLIRWIYYVITTGPAAMWRPIVMVQWLTRVHLRPPRFACHMACAYSPVPPSHLHRARCHVAAYRDGAMVNRWANFLHTFVTAVNFIHVSKSSRLIFCVSFCVPLV